MKLTFITIASFIYFLFPSLYNIELESIDGKEIKLQEIKGKYILIANIAADSSLDKQLSALQQLSVIKSDKLTVIAVPSNSFGHQDKSDSVLSRVTSRYTSKKSLVVTKTYDVAGNKKMPLFDWLAKRDQNGMVDCPVIADYQKFLINEDGKLIGVFGREVSPTDEGILKLIN